MRAIDVRHLGLGEGHLLLGGRRGPRRPRPAVVRGAAARGARRRGAARAAAHAHPLRPRGRGGRARAPLAGPAGLRARARRAAPRRPRAARRQRRAAVRRRGGAARLWGEVVPVPEENLQILAGGETVLGFERRVHARPRLPPRLLPPRADAATRSSATWPACGSRRRAHVLAPTPPPDIDVEAWERSLDLIAAGSRSARLTHFGRGRRRRRAPRAVRASARTQAASPPQHGQEAFVAGLARPDRRARARGRGPPTAAAPRRPPLPRA